MKKSILLVLASLFVMSCSSTVSKENTMEKSNKEKDLFVLPGIGESVKIPYTSPSHFQ